MKFTLLSFIIIFTVSLFATNNLDILNKKKKKSKTLVIGKDGTLQFTNKKTRRKRRISAPKIPTINDNSSNSYTQNPAPPKKRKKATANEYFVTGKEFYSAKNYKEAKQYFSFALDKKKQASYYFWKAMSCRSLKEFKEMNKIFKIIIKKYDNSNVADDALFYSGLLAVRQNNYQFAIENFIQLMEFYPNGTSEINDISFYNEVNKQVSLIRRQVTSRLLLLKYSGSDLKEVLKRFQSKNQLKVNGKMNIATIKKLKFLSGEAIKEIENSKQPDKQSIPTLYYVITWVLLLIAIIWPFLTMQTTKEIELRILMLNEDS